MASDSLQRHKSFEFPMSLDQWALSVAGRQSLKSGQTTSFQITKIKTNSSSAEPDSFIGRLGDLGFQPGEPIFVLGRAPLGEPIFVEVRETVLALRLDEAACVYIELLPTVESL